jgi:hypothetical protein
MNALQARLLITGLQMEIKSGGDFQMTREPAMKTLGRLCGVDAYKTFGRGMKGRQAALEALEQMLLETEGEEITA